MLVWWLTQEDCEQIAEIIDYLRLPKYIASEFINRLGRPGHGRLWADSQFGDVEIPWDELKPMARHCLRCGGIVIHERDIIHLIGLPGFITDLELDLWSRKYLKYR